MYYSNGGTRTFFLFSIEWLNVLLTRGKKEGTFLERLRFHGMCNKCRGFNEFAFFSFQGECKTRSFDLPLLSGCGIADTGREILTVDKEGSATIDCI